MAAGLVAGVLGVGALSAPLLGWTDWPDQLQPGGGNETVQMVAPAPRPTIAQDRPGNSSTPTGPSAVPGVGSATALVIAAATAAPAPARRHRHRHRRLERRRHRPGTTPDDVTLAEALTGDSAQGNGTGTDFGTSGFTAPDLRDTDGDGMPDVWESRNGTDPAAPTPPPTPTATA